MIAPAATPSTAWHGLLPPSQSPLRRAKEGRSFPPLPSTASLPPDRRGRLRNGARPGDFLAAPRCGARTRTGCACRQPAMKNGRCRMHGGLSTGPRTAAGRERCRRARLTHGFYSAEMVALRRAGAACCRRMDAIVDALKVRRAAGHGVRRSKSPSTVGARPPSSPATPSSVSSRANNPRARAARPYANRSNVSAGRGLHPSFSRAPLSPRARRLLAGTAPLAAFSAGHGVHPSFSSPAAIVPAGAP